MSFAALLRKKPQMDFTLQKTPEFFYALFKKTLEGDLTSSFIIALSETTRQKSNIKLPLLRKEIFT